MFLSFSNILIFIYTEKGNIYELNGKYNLKVTENNDGSYFYRGNK